MKVAIVIPARYGSRRFPGKLLTAVNGRPLIERVWRKAGESRKAARVLVATDDEKILNVIQKAGGECLLTHGEFRTGTDRIAAVSKEVDADAFLNLQGDELIRDAAILDDLIGHFTASQPLSMGTLMQSSRSEKEFLNPNVVKVVTDRKGFALYFSRAPIPSTGNTIRSSGSPGAFGRHIGIYIYDKATLEKISGFPTGRLESKESLEQLRALENGIRIKVWETDRETARIDSPEDITEAENLIQSQEGHRSRNSEIPKEPEGSKTGG